MEGAKEALEDFALEAVALYGREAAKLLLHRADIAEEQGDELSAKTWRQVAAIASRITRRTDDRAKPSPVPPQPLRAPRRIGEPNNVLRKKRGRR